MYQDVTSIQNNYILFNNNINYHVCPILSRVPGFSSPHMTPLSENTMISKVVQDVPISQNEL